MKSQHHLKPTDTWEVLRQLRIPAIAHTTQPLTTEDLFSELQGVKDCAVERGDQKLSILYDASQVDYQTIERVLIQAGLPPVNNWWARLKASLYQYSDTNARDNAKAPPPACCNKSPK